MSQPRVECPLRVLVVRQSAGVGGGSRVAGELVREWASMGVEVRTLSLSTSSALGRKIVRHAPHESLQGRSEIDYLIRLRRHLRRTTHRYDVVFTMGDYAAVIAHGARLLLPQGQRPKLVIGVHQPRRLTTSIASSRRTHSVRRVGIRVANAAIRRVDGYVFLSKAQMEDYRGFGVPPEMAQAVIPNPVRFGLAPREHLERRAARLGSGGAIRLVAVGSLNDGKNHLLLLESLARLDHRFALSIVGCGGLEQALRDRSRALGLDERVDFLGPREDVEELLDEHDIFVLSSKYEASPLVVLEAMVRGLPIISTDCAPGFRSLSEAHPAFSVVPLNNSEALAAAIEQVVVNPTPVSELERTAISVLDQHSPRRAAQDHLAFFRKL